MCRNFHWTCCQWIGFVIVWTVGKSTTIFIYIGATSKFHMTFVIAFPAKSETNKKALLSHHFDWWSRLQFGSRFENCKPAFGLEKLFLISLNFAHDRLSVRFGSEKKNQHRQKWPPWAQFIASCQSPAAVDQTRPQTTESVMGREAVNFGTLKWSRFFLLTFKWIFIIGLLICQIICLKNTKIIFIC